MRWRFEREQQRKTERDKCKWKRILPQGAADAEQDPESSFGDSPLSGRSFFFLKVKHLLSLLPELESHVLFLVHVGCCQTGDVESFPQEIRPNCTLGHASLASASV